MKILGSFRSTRGNWREKDNHFWVRGSSENNFLTVTWRSNFAKQVGARCCFAPSNSWLCCADWLQHWQRVKQISVRLLDSEWFPNDIDTVVMDQREREIGSAPLFCLELFRPNFLINKTSTRLQVSLSVCYAGNLFKLSATFTHAEWNHWNCVHCPRSMQMKKGHYQQEKLNQKALSVGEEKGSSVQGKEKPIEDSLGTPSYFQEEHWSKQSKYKNLFWS